MPTADESSRAPAPIDDLPSLEAGRIRLRGFREADFENFHTLHADPRVMRYWSFPAWTERSQARARFADAVSGRDPDDKLCWAVAQTNDDRLIGGVTLFSIDRTQGSAGIGYALHCDH